MCQTIVRGLVAAAILTLWSGCFSDDPLVVTPDSGSETTTTPDATAGDGTTETDTPAGPVILPNSCESDADCSGKVCRSGVCVADPPSGTTGVVTNTDNVATSDPPNLACVDTAPVTPAGPATVTLYGAVARFGNGLKTLDIQVDVFDATTFDPSICESESTPAKVLECYQDYGSNGKGAPPIGTAISSAVTVDPAELPDSCQKPLGDEADHSKCPLGYRCIEEDLDWVCLEQYGLYEIAGIPTNTPLVFRSRATTYTNKWHDSYTFNVYLFADQAEPGDRMQYDATMVSEGQWQLTPNTVGLPPIPEENGAIGGRVRDCRSDRDSWPISQVSLDLANPAAKIVFFNNLEDDTVPLPGRDATNILGRFAALDIPPGWNKLGGSVRIGSDVFSLGTVDVYVFPDSLSLVTFPGLQPYWQQELVE